MLLPKMHMAMFMSPYWLSIKACESYSVGVLVLEWFLQQLNDFFSMLNLKIHLLNENMFDPAQYLLYSVSFIWGKVNNAHKNNVDQNGCYRLL